MRLKENCKRAYVRHFLDARDNAYLLEEQIFGTAALYEASGHLGNFHDPAVRCQSCGSRFRLDHLVATRRGEDCQDWAAEALRDAVAEMRCPQCRGALGEPRARSLMVTMELAGETFYLAPETAQHIFLRYPDGLRWNRERLPFSLHQIGTAARAEITPDLCRRRLFTQMGGCRKSPSGRRRPIGKSMGYCARQSLVKGEVM